MYLFSLTLFYIINVCFAAYTVVLKQGKKKTKWNPWKYVASKPRPPSANALQNFADMAPERPGLTTEFGIPMETKTATMTVGKRGPVLLQDNNFLEDMAHFDRERIPERVVHAKGGGAFGVFETTHDVTRFTRLSPFEYIGKQTDVLIRFSTVGGESGSADTARDPRGFAVKFYSDEGNWDLVGNNTPIFFIRDPILFPSFIHTQKRNPRTHLKDPDAFWDFITLRPETTFQVMILFSNAGTPYGFRHMDGFGSHTFKLVNKKGERVLCKFHFKTNQGIRNFTNDEAVKMAGKNPDFAIQDLYDNIEKHNFPSWDLKLQIMTIEESMNATVNPFDVTKIWDESDFPLIPVGTLTLDRNPSNYFTDIEQAAFSPAHMIPGVEPSEDKMLQGRLFAYGDTHRHRLGTNYREFPVNEPIVEVSNYQRDGPQRVYNQPGPNYFPNSFQGPDEQREFAPFVETYSGEARRFQTGDEDNFSQPATYWSKTLNKKERTDLVNNIAGNLKNAQKFIRKRAVKNFSMVNKDFGRRLQKALDKLLKNC